MPKAAIFCVLILMGAAAAQGCDDDDIIPHRIRSDAASVPFGDGDDDAGSPSFYIPMEPGVCELPDCPAPLLGIACCTPDARCGYDPTGLGLGCIGFLWDLHEHSLPELPAAGREHAHRQRRVRDRVGDHAG